MINLIVDGNIFLMSSVFAHRKNKRVAISYLVLLQLFKYIREFKPNKIYLVADKSSSWRREIYPAYKANRKPFRNSFPDIDWDEVFKEYNELLSSIQSFTPINVVQIEHLEGDDIISYLCRYTPGENIIVSKDKDLSQLLVLPNVKMVYPKKKMEVVEELEGDIVLNKIKKGDASDNIKGAKTLVEAIRNEILIDLLNLPPLIDSTIRTYLDSIVKTENKEMFCKAYPYAYIRKVYNLIEGGED